MAFPENLSKEHLLEAIEKIDHEGVPSMADSQYYDVVFNGKKYPPKLIVSYANLFANGEILDRNSFNGGLGTPAFRLLEKYGFEITPKTKSPLGMSSNIFVFTSSNPDAQKHLKDTIDNPINAEVLKQFLTPEEFEKVEAAGAFYAWGAVPGPSNLRNWEYLKEGDDVLNYSFKHYRHFSRVVLKTRNANLAARLWDKNPQGQTWELMYFLTRPEKLEPPVSTEETAEYLQSMFQGFSKIREEKTLRINREFGGLYEFIKKAQRNELNVNHTIMLAGIPKEEIDKLLTSQRFQNIINSQDFYFEKARETYKDFCDAVVNEAELEDWRKTFVANPQKYPAYIEKYSDNKNLYNFLRLLGELVTYIDTHAANKKYWNRYEDFRAMATTNVRQNNWVDQLIRFKLNKFDLAVLTPNIRNGILFIQDPLNQSSILSENHRKLISEKILEKIPFEPKNFITDLRNAFRPFDIKVANPLNEMLVYSYLMYTGVFKKKWEKTEPVDEASSEIQLPYPHELRKYLCAAKSKPFLIVAGLSGSGKSRLARKLAYKSCILNELKETSGNKPGNFELIQVKPNWYDSSELTGYSTRIDGNRYQDTPFVRFLVKAHKYPEVPFILCLDEMNLAPVEQYFAEYLSAIESRSTREGELISDPLIPADVFDEYGEAGLWDQLELRDNGEREESVRGHLLAHGLTIPNNLVVVGTVNMDETTHSFSRKVLDRAMTFEMNEINLRTVGLKKGDEDMQYDNSISPEWMYPEYSLGGDVYDLFKTSAEKVISFLEKVNKAIDSSPFKVAYRVRDEALLYAYHTSQCSELAANWLEEVIDDVLLMKILPRIDGDDLRTGKVLENLREIAETYFSNARLNRSLSKIDEMKVRLESGYTSYWG